MRGTDGEVREASEMEVIRHPEGGCYLARYLSGPARDEIVALFGTDTVPLPWHHTADPEVVERDVRQRARADADRPL